MIERLRLAIENLYSTFSKYPANSSMQGSSIYGDLHKWNQELFSKSLRNLTDEDLSRFTGKAITTWGNVDDFKHFLPRIFELTAQLQAPYDVSIVFGKLKYAKWETWPIEEQNTVREYVLALWNDLLQNENAEIEFSEYFFAIIDIYPITKDILSMWNANKGKASIKHLTNVLLKNQLSLFEKLPRDENANYKEVVLWFLSNDTITMLEKAYFEFEKEDLAEQISWAEKILNDRLKYPQNK